MNNQQKRIEILTSAMNGREAEVFNYQINIDNYRLAIKEIDENHGEDMQDFRNRLASLLDEALHEQKKEMIMLKIIKQQLEA